MLSYDPADPATRRNPFPLFRRLRAEDPVLAAVQKDGEICVGVLRGWLKEERA